MLITIDLKELGFVSCSLLYLSVHFCFIAMRTPPLSVSLINGPYYSEGVVQVLHNGSWGGICFTSTWGYSVATVVCRELGFPGAASGPPSTEFNVVANAHSPVWLSSVTCLGTEARLSDCTYLPPAEGITCSQNWLGAVVCLSELLLLKLTVMKCSVFHAHCKAYMYYTACITQSL